MSDKPSRRRERERRPEPAAVVPAVPAEEPESPFETARDRLENRFEEPIQRVTTLTQRTLAWFPVRVWRHFLARNGFLLAAGMSYQAIFAVFAGIYVGFAIAGIWLFGNEDALNAVIDVIAQFAPGLVGPDGVLSESDLQQIAQSGVSLFGWTGAAALAGVIWTAIAFITYARIAIRSIFQLPKDPRAYVLLKARDLVASLLFGLALFIAALLSVAATSLLDWLFGLAGWGQSGWETVLVRTGGLVVVFAIDTLSLAALFRFLSGAAVPWRRLWYGSLLGGGALALLQLAANLVITISTNGPLYSAFATFAVFLGLLLWFRISNIIILVAASWIAVEANDRGQTLRRVTPAQLEEEQAMAEAEALLLAAQVSLRAAQEEADGANWLRKPAARRALRQAEQDVSERESAVAELAARQRPASPWSAPAPAPRGRPPGVGGSA
ncbi:YihY/virulence factor BrkB family protein [Agromyces seonyuensis]|uniref:YihY/virulence factor BrkB family protein n=1 Tax=Agromyces seonyuensis TaxID=2662446 RepID=UPI003014CC32